MKRIVLVTLFVVLLLGGCTVVTQDQKDWVLDKANRSAAFVSLMDGGQTTRAQEQVWIRSQDDSWELWAEKVQLGLAAPNWMADATKQATTRPAGGEE